MTDEEVLEAARWAYRAGLAEGELQIARKVIEAARTLNDTSRALAEGSIKDEDFKELSEALEEYDRMMGDD